jgi:biopolymer transport protein ExbB/TolQ
VAIPSYAAYNYLVARINAIVLDMEQVSGEILNIVTPVPGGEPPGLAIPK